MGIAFDFESIKNRILKSLAAKEQGAAVLPHGVLMHLIEAVAEEINNEIQAKEYYTLENWWNLARNRNSLLAESKILHYTYPTAKAAVGQVTFTNTDIVDFSIPEYTVCKAGKIPFTTLAAIESLPHTPGSNSATVNAIQGEWKENGITHTILVSETVFNYTYFLPSDLCFDSSYLQIKVNDVEYTKVDSLFNASSVDKVYELGYDHTQAQFYIKFGNSVFGSILSVGDILTVSYLETLGEAGDTEAGTITKIGTALPGKATVYNDVAFCGGYTAPSLDEIKENAPRQFFLNSRGVTPSDYKALLKKEYPNLFTKLQVYGLQDYIEDNNLDPWSYSPLAGDNAVYICGLKTNGNDLAPLSSDDYTTVRKGIYPYISPTAVLSFQDPDEHPIIAYVSISLSSFGSNFEAIKGNVVSRLLASYGKSVMDFNSPLYYSDVVSTIEETPGVKNSKTYFYAYSKIAAESFANVDSHYTISLTTSLTPINASSVKIYSIDAQGVKTLIGVSTGIGSRSLQSSSTAYQIDGSIKEDSGEIFLDITTLETFSFIQVEYTPATYNIVPPKHNSFVYLENAVVSSY